jgi:TPR repeat protein
MTMSVQVGSGSMIPADSHSPGRFSTAFRLYRTDMVFRGFCDLAMAGVLVLAFSTNWSGVASSLGGIAQQLSSASGPPVVNLSMQSNSAIGQEINKSLAFIHIDRVAIEQSGDPVSAKLLQIADADKGNKPDLALDLLTGLDDRNPLTAYVKAIVMMRAPGVGKIPEIQALLRRATTQGIYPAYLAYGQNLYLMLMADQQQTLPGGERVLIDDAGVAHPASRTEIALAADTWWQKAGAFNRPEGLRMAGFAKARGLSGKVDLVSAAAMWRIAASAGDALSQYELGLLLLGGYGVQADVKEALRLFRLARHKLPVATLALATAQLSSSLAGDIAAAEEGILAAEEAVQRLKGKKSEGMAHYTLGVYLYQAAPPSLRDLGRGVDEFEKATRLGVPAAASFAGAAYRNGIGKPRNPVCAYAFYKWLKESSKEPVVNILTELEAEIGDAGISEAKKIFWQLLPHMNGTGDFEYRKFFFGEEQAKPLVWKSVCSSQ